MGVLAQEWIDRPPLAQTSRPPPPSSSYFSSFHNPPPQQYTTEGVAFSAPIVSHLLLVLLPRLPIICTTRIMPLLDIACHPPTIHPSTPSQSSPATQTRTKTNQINANQRQRRRRRRNHKIACRRWQTRQCKARDYWHYPLAPPRLSCRPVRPLTRLLAHPSTLWVPAHSLFPHALPHPPPTIPPFVQKLYSHSRYHMHKPTIHTTKRNPLPEIALTLLTRLDWTRPPEPHPTPVPRVVIVWQEGEKNSISSPSQQQRLGRQMGSYSNHHRK